MRIFSKTDGRINWGKLNSAVLYAGKALQQDIMFRWNYIEGKQNGVKLGVVYDSWAKNVSDAEAEATALLGWINRMSFDYPVYIDLGDIRTAHLSAEEKEDIAKVFRNKLSNVEIIGVRGKSNWEKNQTKGHCFCFEILRRV